MSQPAVVQSPLSPLSADQPDDKTPLLDGGARADIGRVALFVLGYLVVLRATSIAKGMCRPRSAT